MSIRFKRRIKLFPGVYVNIGKTGVSATIGPRGANINIGKNGAYLNAAVLGTGLSWREKLLGENQKSPASTKTEVVKRLQNSTNYSMLDLTTDSSTSNITPSEGLVGLCEQIRDVTQQRTAIRSEMDDINKKSVSLFKDLLILEGKFFASKKSIRNLENEIKQLNELLKVLDSKISSNRSEIEFDLEPSLQEQYQHVMSTFRKLSYSDAIWDIISNNNSTEAFGANVSTVIKREFVHFDNKTIEFIQSEYAPLHMQNANGADINLFPAFILLRNKSNEIILVDLKELNFTISFKHFIEMPSSLPRDATVVDYRWSKTNKDGSPDLRYKDNVKQSIVKYASLEFTSESGLRETYYVSNLDAAIGFSNELKKYLALLNGEDVTSNLETVPASHLLPVSNSSSPQIITNEYFDLLVGIRDEIISILAIMQKDQELIKSLKDTMGDSEHDPEYFLLYCVTFDIVRVFFELLGEDVSENIIEKSSLAFIVNGLRSDSNTFSNIQYDRFNEMVFDERMGAMTKIYLEIGRSNFPILISIQNGNDDPLKRKAQFAVPAFLISINSAYFDKYAIVLCRLATVIANSDGIINKDEKEALNKIHEAIRFPVPELMQKSIKIGAVNEDQTLEEVLEELDSLVGLESVKHEVKTLVNVARIQKEREKLELKSPQMSFHLVLTGSPGTGKTTVARIVSKIYSKLGILNKGQLVETDKSGLIAGYVGQTPAKVNKAVDSALDGVLFIDEAYSLIQGGNQDYGNEAVATLLKRMEDDRARLVVMVAGYTEEMKHFISGNSGLESRFSKYIEFPDYIPEEMLQIFEGQCQKLDYILEQEARNKALELFETAYEQRDRSFGNGRYVRNIFENSIGRQANRVASLPHLTKEILTTIISDDIPN